MYILICLLTFNCLELKSCASERLYLVEQTLQRSRSNTPTSPPPVSSSSLLLGKTRRFASENRLSEFGSKMSPPVIHSSPSDAPTRKGTSVDVKSFDVAELMVTRANRAIVLEEVAVDEDYCATVLQQPRQSARVSSVRFDSDLLSDLEAYDRIARSASSNSIVDAFGQMRRAPRQDNYLFDWSANTASHSGLPPSTSLPSRLSDPEMVARHQELMRPFRRQYQSSEHFGEHK
jgi:hypothetical protein